MRSPWRLLFFGLILTVFFAGMVNGQEEPPSCKLGSLPLDIQNGLKHNFGAWKVQESENLSDYTRKTWAGKKLPACPGIALGLFNSAKTPSYALLLVPIGHPDAGYRFLVFSRNTGQSFYEATLVEQSDDHGASNYFIRRVSIGSVKSPRENFWCRLQKAS